MSEMGVLRRVSTGLSVEIRPPSPEETNQSELGSGAFGLTQNVSQVGVLRTVIIVVGGLLPNRKGSGEPLVVGNAQ